MKKVLVTGSSGYIGQHLVSLLRHRGDIDLYLLDKDIVPKSKRYQVDIRSRDMLRHSPASLEDFHCIIHLAAMVRVGESVKYPTLYYDTNINGTLNLLNEYGCDNFIFASTGAASIPNSPYGYSKRVAEDIVADYSYDYTTFRFYNVIGSEHGIQPTNPDGLFHNLIQATRTGVFNLYGNDYDTKDGTCVREYVHVIDICRSIIKAIDKPSNKIENLAYGDTRTTLELVNEFKRIHNTDFKINIEPRRPGDLEKSYLENPSTYMERNYTYEEMLRYLS